MAALKKSKEKSQGDPVVSNEETTTFKEYEDE